MSPLTFRRATPLDKVAVLALSAKIDEDYLQYVFDDWVDEEPGGFYLAEDTDRGLVAVVSLAVTGPGEVFLRGMRVDPDYQGRGLGTEFARFQFEEAVRLGAKVVRLTTWEGNYRVHKMMERLGWQKSAKFLVVERRLAATEKTVGVFRAAGADGTDGADGADGAVARTAGAGDIPLVRSVLREWPPGDLVACPHDHWMVCAGWFDVPAEVAAGKVFTDGRAVMILSTFDYPGESGVVVRYLGGPAEAAASLASYAASIAQRLGGRMLCASVPCSMSGPLLAGFDLTDPPPPPPEQEGIGAMGPAATSQPNPSDYLMRLFVFEKRPSVAGL